MRKPALVFIPELVRTGDARHAEYHRRQAVHASIIAYVLLRRALGAAIRRMQIQWLILIDRLAIGEGILRRVFRNRQAAKVAIDLVGGGKEKKWSSCGGARGFQH